MTTIFRLKGKTYACKFVCTLAEDAEIYVCRVEKCLICYNPKNRSAFAAKNIPCYVLDDIYSYAVGDRSDDADIAFIIKDYIKICE